MKVFAIEEVIFLIITTTLVCLVLLYIFYFLLTRIRHNSYIIHLLLYAIPYDRNHPAGNNILYTHNTYKIYVHRCVLSASEGKSFFFIQIKTAIVNVSYKEGGMINQTLLGISRFWFHCMNIR